MINSLQMRNIFSNENVLKLHSITNQKALMLFHPYCYFEIFNASTHVSANEVAAGQQWLANEKK